MNDGHDGVESGASGSYPAGMELRVTRLEDQSSRIEALFRSIDDRIKSIEERLRRLEIDVAEVKGRVATLPGTWAMVTTMIGGQIAFSGLVLAVAVRLIAK